MKSVALLLVVFVGLSLGGDHGDAVPWHALTINAEQVIGLSFNPITEEYGAAFFQLDWLENLSVGYFKHEDKLIEVLVPAHSFFEGTDDSGWNTGYATLFTTFYEWFHEHVASTTFGQSFDLLGLSVGLGLQKLKGEIRNITDSGKNFFSNTDIGAPKFRVGLTADAPLHPDTNHSLAEIESDPTNQALLREWYTVYAVGLFTEATFGWRFNFTSSFSSKLVLDKGSTWSTEQMKIIAHWGENQLGFTHTKSDNITVIQRNLGAELNYRNESIGGDRTVLLSSGAKAWLNTLYGNFASLPLHRNFVPIWEMIPPRFPKAARALQTMGEEIVKTGKIPA